MKLIQAIPSPKPVTESEVETLLDSKLNMQIATIDEQGYPVIQPVWFLYDKQSGKIYSGTPRASNKVRNIQRNPDRLYFSIDDDSYPQKGVKGRAATRILEDIPKNVSIMEKVNMKYLGTLEHPIAKEILGNTRNGTNVVIELTPRFYSAWDFGKFV
ncbi:MAG: pyridoxamine 5'-phosphate oxidase family protein [Nitrososphaera sp.]